MAAAAAGPRPEAEPILDYARLGAGLGEAFANDSARCLATHDHWLALGTVSGAIYVCDPHGRLYMHLRPHRAAVTALSTDARGGYLASAAADGTVAIFPVRCKPAEGPNGGLGEDELQVLDMQCGPLRCIAMDPQFGHRRERMVVVGSERGQLLLDRRGWFSLKREILHEAEGPVSAVAWRGRGACALLAWANDKGVKIMDVVTGERISFIERPNSSYHEDAMHCRPSLRWDGSTENGAGLGLPPPLAKPATAAAAASPRGQPVLWLSWADTIMRVDVRGGSAGPAPQRAGMPTQLSLAPLGSPDAPALATPAPQVLAGVRYAEISLLFTLPVLICGFGPFDMASLVVLGYVPPYGGDEGAHSGRAGSDLQASDSESEADSDVPSDPFQPELLVVTLPGGEILSSDALPLRGWDTCGVGDFDLRVHFRRRNANAGSQNPMAGGAAAEGAEGRLWVDAADGGYSYGGTAPPRIAVLSPRDVVYARLRDVDDKIDWVLGMGRAKDAVTIARKNRRLLKRHDLAALVTDYISGRLEAEDWREAADACRELLGKNDAEWERFVYAFAEKGKLSVIAPHLPVGIPSSAPEASRGFRLRSEIYELVLDTFFRADSRALVYTLRSWRRQHQERRRGAPGFQAPGAGFGVGELFDVDVFLQKINKQIAALARSYAPPDPYLSAALAELLLQLAHYPEALDAFLDSQRFLSLRQKNQATPTKASGGPRLDDLSVAEDVFELIRAHDLWSQCKHRVAELVHIDRDRAGQLLAQHMAALPPDGVVEQLKADREVLHWYLHTLFTKQPEAYNIPEYAHLHKLQIGLYADFAPAATPGPRGPDPDVDSDFLRFLRAVVNPPLPYALERCLRQTPPLYTEAVYIHTKLGNFREAMNVLLRHVGSVHQAIRLIEATGVGIVGASTGRLPQELYGAKGDPELWRELTSHCLANPDSLSDLLEQAGRYQVNAADIVASIPEGMEIPRLKQSLGGLFGDVGFNQELHRAAANAVRRDSLRSLQRFHQRARKGTRMPRAPRCSYCLRTLTDPAGWSARVRGGGVDQESSDNAISWETKDRMATLARRRRSARRAAETLQLSQSKAEPGRRILRLRAPEAADADVEGMSSRGSMLDAKTMGGGGVLVFDCGHAYHATCLNVAQRGEAKADVEKELRRCFICEKQKDTGTIYSA